MSASFWMYDKKKRKIFLIPETKPVSATLTLLFSHILHTVMNMESGTQTRNFYVRDL